MLMHEDPAGSTSPRVIPIPPLAVVPEAAALAPKSRRTNAGPRRLHTAAWFALSFLAVAFGVALGAMGAPEAMVILALLGAAGLFAASILIALWRGLRGVADLLSGDAAAGTGLAVVGNLILGTGFSALGAFTAYLSTMTFSRGRQLRRFGRVLLPSLRADSAWAASPLLVHHEDVPRGLADQWRENGKTEHASVAAFARLTLDLMALGAPPSLIAAAHQDALDEIRHAELCFSLARALDGQDKSPAAFPEAQRVSALPRVRPLALAKLAVDSLVDGALHEGVSARVIAALSRRCEDPGIRAMLREIAADEGRHSAHGWAVVQWCLDEGGRPVAEALLGAVRALPKRMSTDLPAGAADGGWERWGIHGHELEAGEYAAALAHVSQRVHVMAAEKTRTAA